MTIQEYKNQVYEEIKTEAAALSEDVASRFLQYTTDLLINAEHLDGFEECYFEGSGPHGKKIVIDGYDFDDVDNTCNIMYCNFSNSLEIGTLKRTEIERCFGCMKAFTECASDGYIEAHFEPSSPGYEFAAQIRSDLKNIPKFRFIIITDCILSSRVKTLKLPSICGKLAELYVWDLQRFFDLEQSGQGRETFSVDFQEFGIDGLDAIVGMRDTKKRYDAYLTAIQGDILADIYLQYGSRLLEGNVRSFLSTRSKVNKEIRKTIITDPDMFFAYNNGIAATGTDMQFETTPTGVRIKSIDNFQIINGGQTTASIANAVLKKEGDVRKITVPVKLSIIRDEDASEKIIPEIALCANSQNKIDTADFASNHPFQIEFEKMSRSILPPAVGGNQYQIGWFYERARGQFAQAQMKLTASQKKAFLLKWDKKQVIRKVDLAKYMNSYYSKPYIVSRGAQANAKDFHDDIKKRWEKDSAQFNEWYYKKAIALAILFKTTENIVSAQDWYKAVKSYRANIVTYSISIIFDFIHAAKIYDLDYKRIWNSQKIYPELEQQLIKTTKEVFDYITSDERPVLNVTQWCKQELCWKNAKKQRWTILKTFRDSLTSKESVDWEQENAHSDKEIKDGINLVMDVINLGSDYWKSMMLYGKKQRFLTEKEESLLKTAQNAVNKIPSEKQAAFIMKIKEKAELEGFQG